MTAPVEQVYRGAEAGSRLASIIDLLRGAHRNGSGWTARCPAHEDRNPSLSVDERDGKILLHCHAGCTLGAICAALGIEVRDLFADGAPAPPRIAVEYPYEDERGEVLFEVVRFEPKSFRQRRPDRHGGWIWNVNGTRRALYRLPEVLAAESVLIVEGEKDVESARSLGLVATCNPGGAGKWCEEYSETLRGKHVAIIADADQPGRKHAQQIAASLFDKVESLKVVEFPTSKDLSEWLETGGNREVLLGWIEDARVWTPATERAAGAIRRWEQIPRLCDLENTRVSWLCEELIPRSEIILLAGEPGAYKTWLALRLAKAVAQGEAFLGRKCDRAEVLCLDRENPRAIVCERRAILAADTAENIRYWDRLAPESPPLIGDIRLFEIARERRPLIIFDSLVRFHSADENSATEMAPVMAELRKLADAGATVLLLHHKSKAEGSRYRGSSDILAGADVAYTLSKDETSGLLTIRTSKSRHRELSVTIRPDLDQSGDFILTDSPAVASERDAAERLARVIAEHPGSSQDKVIELSGLPRHRTAALLKNNPEKLWRSEDGPRRTRRYYPPIDVGPSGSVAQEHMFRTTEPVDSEETPLSQWISKSEEAR
jgi:putative DNA primase/helicase